MERELEDSKQMNKAFMILIVFMLILMIVQVAYLVHLEKQYEQLEGRYTELYQEMTYGGFTGLGNAE